MPADRPLTDEEIERAIAPRSLKQQFAWGECGQFHDAGDGYSVTLDDDRVLVDRESYARVVERQRAA